MQTSELETDDDDEGTGHRHLAAQQAAGFGGRDRGRAAAAGRLGRTSIRLKSIDIVAVHHTHRDPDGWKSRF